MSTGAASQLHPALVEPGPSTLVAAAPADSGTRAAVVHLLPSGAQERKLRRLADAASKLWNELNYDRRQAFLRGERIDFEATRRKHVPNYTGILGASAWVVERKNDEAWRSFFGALGARKEGRLPPWIHPRPPGYRKDRATGRRRLWIPIRHDAYVVDPEAKVIHIPRYGLRLRFAGDVRWYGKQGRMEIWYDEAERAWHASIAVQVGAETTRNGTRPRHMVRGERRSIEVAKPKGEEVAGIDLGVKIIASVVVSDGSWIVYRGARLREDYFHFERRIAGLQSEAESAKSEGDEVRYRRLWAEVRRLKRKLTRRRTHLYRTLASHLVRGLW
ncbi:MAG: transposase, partial [Conexivisphaera sp.]